jgi:hypothetical protein
MNMTIMNTGKNYTDVAMTKVPFLCFIDELISDKATKNIDGWQLSLCDLTNSEIHQLEHLQNCYGDLQALIDQRCDDRFENWRNARGFDD